jgi:hypothetical protein
MLALFWYQHFSGISTFLFSAFLWYQHFSDVMISLVSALFWYQDIPAKFTIADGILNSMAG